MGKTFDVRAPFRVISTQNLPLSTFRMLAIFTHDAAIAYSVRKWIATLRIKGTNPANERSRYLSNLLVIAGFSQNAKKVVVPDEGVEPPTLALQKRSSGL